MPYAEIQSALDDPPGYRNYWSVEHANSLPDEAIAWARATCSDFAPWATGDVYLNFVGDEGQDRVVAGFGEDNYRRMAAVKAQFDPDNVFRLGHNVTPAAA